MLLTIGLLIGFITGWSIACVCTKIGLRRLINLNLEPGETVNKLIDIIGTSKEK